MERSTYENLSSSREMRNLAEKMRRDKLNKYVMELASIVPLVAKAGRRVDKISVLRLAASYIRMHNVLFDDESRGMVPHLFDATISSSLSQAIGGFLLVVTSTGKVVYIAEAVEHVFRHSQFDLFGRNIYSIIHPEDHHIMEEQLSSTDTSRRSFFCRMTEKTQCRSDPRHYEIVHIVGTMRPLLQPVPSKTSHTYMFAPTKDSFDGEDSITINPNPSGEDTEKISCYSDSEDCEVMELNFKSGTHMLVSFVRVVKNSPITDLSLAESTQDEYITRHTMDGKILYSDHRISFVTGLMPVEVMGTSAFQYMHPEDMMWSMMAHKLMFSSSHGQGMVSYRLKCRDSTHVTLRSQGYIEVNKQTGQVDTFVCINTVVSIEEAEDEINNQRRKLLPLIISQRGEDHLSSVSSKMPPELLKAMKNIIDPENVQKIISSVEPNPDREPLTDTVIPQDTLSSDTVTLRGLDDPSIIPKHPSAEPIQCSSHLWRSYSNDKCILPQGTLQALDTFDNNQLHAARKRGPEEELFNIPSKKMSLLQMPTQQNLHSCYAAQNIGLHLQHIKKLNIIHPRLSLSTSPVQDHTSNCPSGSTSQISNVISTLLVPGNSYSKVNGSMSVLHTKNNHDNFMKDQGLRYNDINFTPCACSYQHNKPDVMYISGNGSLGHGCCRFNTQSSIHKNEKYVETLKSSSHNNSVNCGSPTTTCHEIGDETVASSSFESVMLQTSDVYPQHMGSTKQLSQCPNECYPFYNWHPVLSPAASNSYQGIHSSFSTVSHDSIMLEKHQQLDQHHYQEQEQHKQEQQQANYKYHCQIQKSQDCQDSYQGLEEHCEQHMQHHGHILQGQEQRHEHSLQQPKHNLHDDPQQQHGQTLQFKQQQLQLQLQMNHNLLNRTSEFKNDIQEAPEILTHCSSSPVIKDKECQLAAVNSSISCPYAADLHPDISGHHL